MYVNVIAFRNHDTFVGALVRAHGEYGVVIDVERKVFRVDWMDGTMTTEQQDEYELVWGD